MITEKLKNTFLNIDYVNRDGVVVNENIRVDPHVYPTVKWDSYVSNSVTYAADTLTDTIDKRIKEFLDASIKKAVTPNNTETKKEKNEMSTITGKINNPVKNVLFLAPGYQYALTVINNQSKELDRKKIPYNSSKEAKDLYISTDKVHVEIVYADPVKWTPNMFMKRDAFFGKKELIDKAKESFPMYVNFKKHESLSKYIRDLHADHSSVESTKPRETYIPEIKNVYFNDPVTVVLWEDGTKTVVKCQENDVYSADTGLALCISKKALGNMGNFNNIFNKWVPKDSEPLNIVMEFDNVGFLDALKDGSFYNRVKEGIQRAFTHDEV